MVVYEKIILNQAGAFAMSMPHPGFSEREYRGKSGLYAKFFANNGTVTDLFESATLPQSSKHPHWRQLPERVFGGADGRTIFNFRVGTVLTGGPMVMVGVLNVITGEILAEEAYKVGGSLLGKISGSPPIGESRMIACSRDGSMALFCAPRQGVFAVEMKKGLPYVFKPMHPGADFDFATSTANTWIICTDSLARKNIGILDQASGKLIHEVALKKTVVSFDVAQQANMLVIGFMGGAVNTLGLDTFELTEYLPNRGADRNDWATVRISNDGRYVLSKMGLGKPLMLTDTQSGRSMPWMELGDYQVQTPSGGKHVFIPDVQFADDQLVVLSNAELARYDIPEIRETEGFISQPEIAGYKKPPRYNKKKTLRENLQTFKLDRVAEQIMGYWSPAYAIKLKRAGKKALPVGNSRLGGEPDLPESQVWPVYNNIAMAFIAQINLQALAAVQKHHWLPDDGLLSIFMSVGEEPFPLGDASDKGAWKVLYSPAAAALQRIATPQVPEDAAQFINIAEAEIQFKKGGRSLPSENSLLVDVLQLSDEEKQNYIELIRQINRDFKDDEPAHQFMGYPTELQGNDMESACALASVGKDPFKAVMPDDPDYRTLLQQSARWSLLLQLDSDETNSDMLWGDAGLYYWFVPREELKQLIFENVWGQIQCH